MNIEPKSKYILTFAKDENGNDIKYRFMLTLSKRVKTVLEAVNSCMGMPGVDGASLAGNYTLEIIIARTFDPDEVIEEIKKKLDTEVLTEIIQPKLITP